MPVIVIGAYQVDEFTKQNGVDEWKPDIDGST